MRVYHGYGAFYGRHRYSLKGAAIGFRYCKTHIIEYLCMLSVCVSEGSVQILLHNDRFEDYSAAIPLRGPPPPPPPGAGGGGEGAGIF